MRELTQATVSRRDSTCDVAVGTVTSGDGFCGTSLSLDCSSVHTSIYYCQQARPIQPSNPGFRTDYNDRAHLLTGSS